MTKSEFLSSVKALYRVGNYADSDHASRETWTSPKMAQYGCCGHLDRMLSDMLDMDVISSEEHQHFYDTI